MAQTQVVVTVVDVGFNPGGELMAKIMVSYRPFQYEAKRNKVSGWVNLSEWIKNDG